MERLEVEPFILLIFILSSKNHINVAIAVARTIEFAAFLAAVAIHAFLTLGYNATADLAYPRTATLASPFSTIAECPATPYTHFSQFFMACLATTIEIVKMVLQALA